MASDPERPDLHVIDIFMMSIKCGNCDTYQTIVKFQKGAERNVYTYECENDTCDPNVTRTLNSAAEAASADCRKVLRFMSAKIAHSLLTHNDREWGCYCEHRLGFRNSTGLCRLPPTCRES